MDYKTFCLRMGIDPQAPDSRIRYEQYLEAKERLDLILRAGGEQ